MAKTCPDQTFKNFREHYYLLQTNGHTDTPTLNYRIASPKK